MNKSIFYAVAVAGVLTGCSQDDAGSGTSADDNSRVPITIGMSSASSSLTRGTGTVGGFEGDNAWAGQSFNVYMFEKGTLTMATDNDGSEIYNNFEFTAPDDGSSSGTATAYDNSVKYYPTTGVYDFVGYHIDDAGGANTPYQDGDSLMIDFTIDGSQDLMNAIATPSESDEATLGDGVSMCYSAYSARRDVNPNLVFNHLLTRLQFSIQGGNKETCYDEDDVTTATSCVKVTSIKVTSKTTGRFVIAKVEDGEVVRGGLYFDDVKTALSLKQRGDGADANTELVDLEPVMPVWNSAEGMAEVVQVGEALLVAPDDEYAVEVVLTQEVPITEDGTVSDNRTITVNDVIALSDGATFEAGSSYAVKVIVYGINRIVLDSELTPWVDGGNIDITPQDAVIAGTND